MGRGREWELPKRNNSRDHSRKPEYSQELWEVTSLLFWPNSDRFRTCSGAVRRPCTRNVRSEPVQGMFCVVKRETSPVCRWKLCDFQHRKRMSVSGINLIVWRE